MSADTPDDDLLEDDTLEDDTLEDDDFLLEDDGEEAAPPTIPMLIVDDEPGIHDVTRLAMTEFRFQGCRLEMLSAFSGAEARALLAERDDVAVILLDVVMETETAGLDLVRAIRRDLGNTDVRIILRTGQPGQAPEEKVIVEYDINDYKAKSELTRSHLLTSVTSALRSWRDIQELHRYRRQAYAVAGRQSALIEAALNLLAVPAAVLDPDGLIVTANAALAARAGRGEAEDLIGFEPAALGLPDVSACLSVDDAEPAPAGVHLAAVRTPEGVVDAWLLRLDGSAGPAP